MQENQFNITETDIIPLPSKGYLYPSKKDSITIEYMTAQDEDLLTTTNYLLNGMMIEKLLEKKVKDRDISPEDLFEGDINAILLNLRISAYGPEYECTIFDPTCGKEDNFIVDLGRLSYKEFDLEKYPMDGEYFTYTLPISKHKVKFRLLTHKEEKEIGKTVEELAKYNGGINTLFTSKLKARVMEVSGSNQGKSFIYTDKGQISNYVMKMKSLDALKLTNYINEVEPNLDLNYKFISKVTGKEFHAKIQLTLTKLFYPESSI